MQSVYLISSKGIQTPLLLRKTCTSISKRPPPLAIPGDSKVAIHRITKFVQYDFHSGEFTRQCA